ncbi:MAG: S41 family peptidase [Flavitalea sp.]
MPIIFLIACSASRSVSIENKKYSPDKLKKDYSILRAALEDTHPSLYWFTSKDSMNKSFDDGYSLLNDSMTERQFRTNLLKVVAAIKCGHTSVNYSKAYSRYLDTANLTLFPLAIKAWKDTLVVTVNLNKKDSLLTRGTIITAINNRPASYLIDTFLNYITGDGNSMSGRYQSLSSFGTFGVMYKNVFGLTDSFDIEYQKTNGTSGHVIVPVYKPEMDSTDRVDSLLPEKYTAKERRNMRSLSSRNLQVDTTLHSGYMTVNTFASANGLKSFFRSSFRNAERLHIKYLAIDVRSNGGGDAGNSTLLTRYLSDHSFVLAHSLYTTKRSNKFRQYIRFQPIYWLMTTFVTHKKSDGYFHFGYFERHKFKPKKKHHFNGKVYILTGGNSFSATTLFVQELKGQPNITVVGEETGGGAYGNTAWIIPELILPETKLRIGIPRFRFVMRPELIKDGRGVLPDVYAAPSPEDIRKGFDVKVETVRQLIVNDWMTH